MFITEQALIEGVNVVVDTGVAAVYGLPVVLSYYTNIERLLTLDATAKPYATRTNQVTMMKVKDWFERWASTHYEWALAGQRDDGSVYTLDRWYLDGAEIARESMSLIESTVAPDFLTNIFQTAKDIANTRPPPPEEWPWWVYGLGALVALKYGSDIVGNFRGR